MCPHPGAVLLMEKWASWTLRKIRLGWMRLGNVTQRVTPLIATLLLCAPWIWGQSPTPSSAGDPWLPLRFLEGTWNAKTTGGSAHASASGAYTFRKDLKGHILGRYGSASGCTGPA